MTPTLAGCKAYLGDTSWDDATITSALTAETASQIARCRIPSDGLIPPALVYSADLVEALYRRVAHNLALRGLPLGVQSTVSEMNTSQMRVGGLDAEVRRLEAPYRRLAVG